MSPIIDFLCKHNNFQVLCVAGINDFAYKSNTFAEIKDNFEIFCDTFELVDGNIKFIGLPLVPSLSLLKHDGHRIRYERTQEILDFNDLITKHNCTAKPLSPSIHIPSLKHHGLKQIVEGTIVDAWAHVPDLWDRWDDLIPNKNCMHLAPHVKRAFWTDIQEFFNKSLQ